MKAAVLYGPRQLVVEDIELKRPSREWAVVEVKAAGICGTDKAFYTGSYPLFKKPLVPGHEVSGVVVEGPRDLVGLNVVSEINFACRKCRVCQAGLYTHCPNKLTLGIDFDGGMAEYFTAPLWALHTHKFPHERAFAAEPLAAVLHMFRVAPPRPGNFVAILGTGFLAYLSAQVARLLGANVVVVSRPGSVKARQFELAGFKVVHYEEAHEIGSSMTDYGLGYDMVVEATGTNAGLMLAVELVRPRGIVHLKSTPGGVAEYPQTLSVVKEVQLMSTRCGDWRDFKLALQLLSAGKIDVPVTKVYSLDDAVEAFERSLERDAFRVLVKP